MVARVDSNAYHDRWLDANRQQLMAEAPLLGPARLNGGYWLVRYRFYGKTHCKVSLLGFGAMKLPVRNQGKVDFDKSTAVVKRALELGVNIFDSSIIYGQSEKALGIALEGIPREKYFIQTKNPTWKPLRGRESYRSRLERALKALKTGYIDFYLAHDLGWDIFKKAGKRFMKEMRRAQSEGLVRHIGFSTHDSEQNMIRLIETGLFECILCQYNLIDLSNARVMEHAHSKGVGVSVMGPVGGGRLAYPTDLTKSVPGKRRSDVEAAFRFVFSNRHVDTAFSGMFTIEQVEENARTASHARSLTKKELERIKRLSLSKKELSKLYCTGCNYCMPCPHGVAIPSAFTYLIWRRVYGINNLAHDGYKALVKQGKGADKCVECGRCEKHCPQKIEIIKQLKEAHEELSASTSRRK